MGKKKKAFIDKKDPQSHTFSLVHRSQRDPLGTVVVHASAVGCRCLCAPVVLLLVLAGAAAAPSSLCMRAHAGAVCFPTAWREPIKGTPGAAARPRLCAGLLGSGVAVDPSSCTVPRCRWRSRVCRCPCRAAAADEAAPQYVLAPVSTQQGIKLEKEGGERADESQFLDAPVER